MASYFTSSANSAIIISRSQNGKEFAERLNVNWGNWTQISDLLDSIDVIVNCTSVGFGDQEGESPLSEIQLANLKKSTIIFDIIYQPLETKLLELAVKNNIPTFNGLEMNLEQAVLAYKYTVKTNKNFDEIRSIMLQI